MIPSALRPAERRTGMNKNGEPVLNKIKEWKKKAEKSKLEVGIICVNKDLCGIKIPKIVLQTELVDKL